MGDGNVLGVFAADIIVSYDCAAGLGVFDGIADEIEQHLAHPVRVVDHARRQVRAQAHGE